MPSKTSKLSNGARIYNATIANDKSLQALPKATNNNIGDISNILFNDEYQPQLNQFVNNLVNRIAMTIIRNKTYDNPLSVFKKGSMPLGTDIQDLYTNPAERNEYEISDQAAQRLLTLNDPDTNVAYYRRNRQDFYKKTVTREALQAAFVSWDDFNAYVDSITNSLYSGNYIDEFKFTKALVDGAYDNNKVITEVVTNPTDEASANAFLKAVKTIYDYMTFPSTDYNAYSKFSGAKGTITTWTDKDRICLVIRADVMNALDVDALARAFNIDKAEFMGRIYKVDKFENPDLLGIICDESWFQIYDNIFRFDTFYNPEVMAWNLYLHAWETFAICPFANAVAICAKEPTDVTAITVGSGAIALTMDAPEGKAVDVTVTPEGADTTIDYTVEDPTVASVTVNTNTNVTVKPLKVGSTKLKAVASNGVKAEQTVNVTQTGA